MTAYHNWLPKAEPHVTPDHDDDVTMAVRAWSLGTANAAQQKLAWDYVMYLTKADERFQDLSYRPGDAGRRSSDFAEGSKAVGLWLRRLLRPEFTPKHAKPGQRGPQRPSVRDLRNRRRLPAEPAEDDDNPRKGT